MPIVHYTVPSNPPCRAVLMTAEKLNIKLDQKIISMRAKEHLKPEFLAMNPLHSVPVIDDDGFILWVSHAIMTYLVNKYAPGNSLYPEDPKIRASVDRMLFFETASIYKTIEEYMAPSWEEGLTADPEKREALKKNLAIFDTLLGKTSYAAADHLTLADFSLVASLASIVEGEVSNLEAYPRIKAWYEKLKAEIPHFQEINQEPIAMLKNGVKKAKLNFDI